MGRIKANSIPNIEHNIRPPYEDSSILEFYKGYYDSVYIILHPFVKVTHTDKIDLSLKRLPTKAELIEYSYKVSWAEFLKLSGIKDITRLDIALRNLIGGLNKRHSNEEDLNLLKQTIEKNNLIMPTEGCFSFLLIDEMLKALIDLGHDWIFIGYEHGTERKIEFIEEIIDNKLPLSWGHECWYTTKSEILYATHWDSHFTLLCSNKQTIGKILKEYPFEGFYCDTDTEVYWSVRSKI